MTDRLSPADAGFLYTEDAATPMQVGGVVILQPERPFDYTQIVALIEARLALVPRYRQKVRFVPGRFARPVWVDDENFDLTYHVRRSALPKPGSDAQLAELVGRLISRPLDRSRPLWELYVVEGLSGGRIALINKTHHSMVDRVGAVDVAAAILDISPRPRRLPAQVWLPTPAPSDIDLVVDAIADITSRPSEVLDAFRLAALDIKATVAGIGQTVNGIWQIAQRAVRPAPRSALDVAVAGPRRFVGVALDLALLKTIRKTYGGTVNDVILTVITGALRSFLLSRGEPVSPGTTLRAMVPMSVRATLDQNGRGSEFAPVASYLIDLPVSEPNPVIRLSQVSFAMAAHTESGLSVGADSLMKLGRFAPATLHTLGARVGSQLGRRLYNLLIINIPGPQIPLFAAGVPVVAMYPVAPLAKGQALALSVTSYNGQVFFGLTADGGAVPDLADFNTLLQEAVEEFPSAIGTRSRSPMPPPADKPPKPPPPADKPPKPPPRARRAAAPLTEVSNPIVPSVETALVKTASKKTAPTPTRTRARPRPAPKPTPPRARQIPTGSEAPE